ncbi:hypothetical protein [Streptomyces sp. NPDC091217]|uniref:hypothetical protein n=1 Tax=Streptomyces sp. NPDC091217 TaxID=3365975 RepID=UPI00382C014E
MELIATVSGLIGGRAAAGGAVYGPIAEVPNNSLVRDPMALVRWHRDRASDALGCGYFLLTTK